MTPSIPEQDLSEPAGVQDIAPMQSAPESAPALPRDSADQSQDESASTGSAYTPQAVPKQSIQGDPPGEPLVGPAAGQGPSVAFPSAMIDTLIRAQSHLPDNFEPEDRWANVMELAQTVSTEGEYESALNDSSRQWDRVVQHQGRRLGAQNLTTPSISGQEVSGDAALMAYRSHARSSAGANIFFWGSGVSIKFNALPNETLYHLSRELASSRITAGRSTYAVALSQHMVYTAEAVLETAKSARFKSSLNPNVDIGDVIRITDFNTLVWGLAVATFPQGFDIERGCIAKPGTCQHTTKERVAVRRMQVVDHTSMSEEQRAWMATLQDGKHTAADVLSYQDKFAKLTGRDYSIDHDNGHATTITLKVPTLNEFISAGKLWIDDVNRAVVQAIGESASFAERNSMMSELMQVANARQFSHWVESISFGGGKVTSPESIRRILAEEISGDDVQLASFIKAVRDFNDKVVTSVVAINNFKCPSCGSYQMVVEGSEGADEQPPTYVPVEVVSTFFALIYQRLGLR